MKKTFDNETYIAKETAKLVRLPDTEIYLSDEDGQVLRIYHPRRRTRKFLKDAWGGAYRWKSWEVRGEKAKEVLERVAPYL